MKQRLALEIMHDGHSVFLTGQAGSGKTYVLNTFITQAKANKKHVAVTATTGLAATHLGGTTIHAWSGIGIHSQLPKTFFKELLKGRRDTILKADILIIDEISMLHDYRLDMVEEVTRMIRGNDKPFGGLQVILCGDFFQLPPVNRSGELEGGFVVHSKAWQLLQPTVCYLSEQHRQEDDDFLDILMAMRAGDVRRKHAENLLSRVGGALPGTQPITELHTTNIDVDSINAKALQALHSDSYTYVMETTGKDHYVATLKKSCLAAEQLELKKGALVMCIKNSPDKKYANGSLGIVKRFDPDTKYPIVELRNGTIVVIIPETWELRDGDKKRASITQLPLRLAWAITIHKSQGMTLDAARIDLRKAFVEGMGYVALSRVKRLDSLTLIGINRMALQVSPDALAIDKTLQEQSKAAYEKFKHLEKKARKRSQQAAQKPKLTLQEIRQIYPRAYLPWEEKEDKDLLKRFKKGQGAKEMAAALHRQPGSIRMRLKKHLGDDITIKA